MVLGLVVAVGRLSSSRVLSFVSATYVEVFRDTPVLVQLFWVYYVLPVLLGIRIDALTASIIGLTLHSAAFLSEIYRAGIQTVPVGHIEAAKVLGLSRVDTFIRIVMPQAVRNVLPPLVNNLIDLIKLSSLSSVFAVGEITRKAGELSASDFSSSRNLYVCSDYVFYDLLAVITSDPRARTPAAVRLKSGSHPCLNKIRSRVRGESSSKACVRRAIISSRSQDSFCMYLAENPPGDTSAVAAVAAKIVSSRRGEDRTRYFRGSHRKRGGARARRATRPAPCLQRPFGHVSRG